MSYFEDTLSESYDLEIPRGNAEGLKSVNKFGANTNIAKDTTADVWDGGGLYKFPTKGTAPITHFHQLVDQVAMRGRLIEVQGLDITGLLVVQTKVLNATDTSTLVALDTPLWRVFRLKVLANVVIDSEIHVSDSLDVETYAIMGIGNNQTLMAIYTVPLGYTAYLTKYYCTAIPSTNKTPTATVFKLWSADRDNGYEFQIKHIAGIPINGDMVEHEFIPYAGKATQLTDIKITAEPRDEAGDVAAGFDLIIVEN